MTDATGAVTTTAYDAAHDLPSVVTDAMGNTSCYKYDHRGRKIAEWGTALQPACFGYDDMDNMITLRTFRADNEVITTDPSERTDGDVTTWAFNPVTGLEISKTYADNTTVVKTYDAYNRLATETDARGNIKTHSYEHARGLHLGTSYTVVDGSATTATRSFSYNHLGEMTQVMDDAGTRTLGYNAYGEQETDSLVVDNDTHLITEQRDGFGRSTGYTYAKNGAVQQTVSTGYGDDGRIDSAGFLHGGAAKNFGYTYLAGTNLLQVLTKPNGMTLTQTYETTRDLLTGMAYHRGTTLVAQREYTYDILGRPTARTTSRQGTVVNDTFVHNSRSELASAQVNGETYGYDYDNVGNRRMSMEAGDYAFYEANELNQYSDITGSEDEADFSITPVFDADGNQTMIKTATGIWHAGYNAENRPVSFTNEATGTEVTCAYDSMGRRSFKQITVNGTVTLHQRYLYRGYLQIACIDLTRSHHPGLWLITWDPTQPIATRPLAIQKDGTWHTYGLDLTKNVCEVFGTTGYISTAYTYTPYGSVTATGNTTQPIQWSSEFYDSELALIYYNYRHYNPVDGRWIGRDIIEQNNKYVFIKNSAYAFDLLGAMDVHSLDVVTIKSVDLSTSVSKEEKETTKKIIASVPVQVTSPPGLFETNKNQEKLVFDGYTLYIVSMDFKKCKSCWEATSGKGINGVWDFSTEQQKEKGVGPIPAGIYIVPVQRKDDRKTSEGIWQIDDWENLRKEREASNMKFSYLNRNKRNIESWGHYAVRLRPDTGTNTYGRTVFNIHGGYKKGSAGCIDIGKNDISFFEAIMKYSYAFELHVDYSGAKSKACRGCKDIHTNAWD